MEFTEVEELDFIVSQSLSRNPFNIAKYKARD